jgi:hypothetical protein
MARRTQPKPAAQEAQGTQETYEPERIYDVRLARAVKVGAATIRPLGAHQMTGATLTAIVAEQGADAIDSAKPR